MNRTSNSLFTPEELAELAAFDAEVDNAPLTMAEHKEATIRDREARRMRLYGRARAIAEHQRRYYEANKDAIAEYKRRYYEANKDAIAEHQRRYRAANKDAIAEYQRRYRAANKDAIAEQQRRYRAARKKET